MLENNNKSKVSFVISGAHRSGHTSIHHCLSQHPALCVLPLDRSGYFSINSAFASGVPHPLKYEQLFNTSSSDVICGEVSRAYFSDTSSISRIYHYNPSVKIIVCLRNPAERAYSHWQEAVSQGVESRTFRAAITSELDSIKPLNQDQSTHPSGYLAKSMYSNQIQCLHQYFDPHQLLFIKSEDLRDDTEVVLFQILQFLSVPYTLVDCSAQNIGSYDHHLSTEDRTMMTEILREDIDHVETLLGWNCADWAATTPEYDRQLVVR